MIISLIGYMGSGKSHIAKLLSDRLGIKLIDIDKEISKKNKMTIAEMFQKKGEIFFRRQERALLEEIVATEDSCILSLGGGTPAYYNNIELINQNSESIFLRTSVKNLTERLLKQKHKRPLIANISDQDLPEFIAKHLFERNIFYNKAKYTVNTDDKTPEMVVEELCDLL